MNKNFKVSFLLSSKSKMKQDGRIAILYRIHLGSQRMDMGSTGMSIDPKLWDSGEGKVSGRTREAIRVNKQLDDMESDLRHIFRKLEFSDILSLARIKDIYLGNVQPDVTFLEYFDRYIELRAEEVGNTLSKASLQKYKVTRRRFAEYLMSKYKKKDVKFSELNYNVIWNFKHYLLTKGKMRNNTCMRMLRTLKTVIILARREGLLSSDPYPGIKIRFDPPKHRFLTEGDILKILQKKFVTPRLERVRDLFIFSCFTGLSYADINALRKENVMEMNGKKWLIMSRKKTGVLSTIPLLEIPLQLLAKYEGRLEGDRLLPTLSNQRMNQYLKEIGDVCDINKELTCHVARHTFGTLAISLGVSTESVSKMLGHVNQRTTKIYAAITDEKVKREMEFLADKIDDLNEAFALSEKDIKKRDAKPKRNTE